MKAKMNLKDFEVGKKYRSKKWTKGTFVTCIGYDTDGDPVVQDARPDSLGLSRFNTIYAYPEWEYFEEYREPREFWIVGDRVFKDFASAAVFHADELEGSIEHEILRLKEVIE